MSTLHSAVHVCVWVSALHCVVCVCVCWLVSTLHTVVCLCGCLHYTVRCVCLGVYVTQCGVCVCVCVGGRYLHYTVRCLCLVSTLVTLYSLLYCAAALPQALTLWDAVVLRCCTPSGPHPVGCCCIALLHSLRPSPCGIPVFFSRCSTTWIESSSG